MPEDEPKDERTRSFVALSAGTTVSHYKIIEKIGAGGMGEVYLAEDIRLNRTVALKFLPLHLCQDDESRMRFIREARAAASLDHPNIATIYEVDEYQGRPFFSMKVVEGKSLKDTISGKDLPNERILEIGIQLCEGLQAAHDKGIIHRDIKPSNILLDSHGRVRIVDFGLASIVGSSRLTKSGSTLGTIGYMSPEQVRGRQIDHRSDLFSLGVVLYELIAKQNPFKRESEAAILKAVADDAPEPLARYKADVSSDLQRVVSKLLEKNPKLRYQSAADVASDLTRMLGGISPAAISVHHAKRLRPLYLILPAAIVLIVASLYMSHVLRPGTETNRPAKKMLVVLPFENLGSAEDEYFADGITDEITSRLASVSGLGVISRTSAIQYKHTKKSLPQIAAELGVDYVLEGTIRWDKSGGTSKVRITPQLISVIDNTHIWAENYERELTQIFQVQSDIASEVAKAIGIELVGGDKQRVESRPTDNLAAYDLYLRGRARASRSYEESDFRAAIVLLDQAVNLDSSFVEAMAVLAYAHIEIYYVGYDHTAKRLNLARALIERARLLQPDNPDVIFADAVYDYHGMGDYESALKKIQVLIERYPNRVDSYRLIAAIKRRQGKWKEAIGYHAKIDSLNPMDAREIAESAWTYTMMRMYGDAEKLYKHCIAIAPDVSEYYVFLSELYILGYGDVNRARQFIIDSRDKIDNQTYQAELAQCDTYDRQYTRALERLSEPVFVSAFEDSSDYYRTKGGLLRLIGDSATGRIYFDSSLIYLNNLPAEARQQVKVRLSYAFTYAGLGRREEALQAAQEAVELAPLEKDAVMGAIALTGQAFVLLFVGDIDDGLRQLDYCLSIPSMMSANILRLSPLLDFVRHDPRFQAVIKKYEGDAVD